MSLYKHFSLLCLFYCCVKTEASRYPQFDGTAECKASWDTSHAERRPTKWGGNWGRTVVEKFLNLMLTKMWEKVQLFLSLIFVSVQAEQLRQHYMTKYDSEVADAHQSLQPVLQNIKELKNKVRSPLTSTLIYSRRYTALLCSIICLHIYWQMISFYIIKMI